MHIPSIEISPASPPETVEEPYSPFSTCTTPTCVDEDGFRPLHLTPPPSAKSPRQLSPLRPLETLAGKGLERDRFEALLQAQRERNAALGSKRSTDLRKEIALKAHKNKQVERRALFLSKVLAPPSPTATITPKTPPESPAIFHYTLPSPGLVSPLALFETLEDPARGPTGLSRELRVEQVDFRLPRREIGNEKEKEKGARNTLFKPSLKGLPSLDQISARLKGQAPVVAPTPPVGRSARLPAFLANRIATTNNTTERPRVSIGIGRLQIPVRTPKPEKVEKSPILPPKSPMSLLPQIQVTTTLVPRIASSSPTELTEDNLQAFHCRERRAQDMLSTLRRRTVSSDHGLTGHENDERDVKWKRHSAPADLAPRSRTGFEHAVLSLPGGF
ncbi:hypothetical protein BDN72DRAFT_866746 [Pluteus cervinus]|uniref:Uncharacterized protein n=1 Tax=Pluteus cervinus TaxID=181527 RepID=A0ACD3BGG5_9AGAR|nr:hypothetical protein BDN72DRAFT_866746 [Pluteus cervinus]